MAGYSINRIPDNQKRFISAVPNFWTTNGSGLGVSTEEKYPADGSLGVSLQVGNYIAFNTDTNPNNGLSTLVSSDGDDVGDTVSAFVWVKSNKPIIVNFTVRVMYPNGIPTTTPASSASRSIAVTSSEWTLLRLIDMPIIPDDAYNYPLGFSITVQSIEGGSDAYVNISHPVIYGTLDFINNPLIIDLLLLLPEYFRDADVNPGNYITEPNYEPIPYQLARFLEMASIHSGEISDLIDLFIYQDISEGKKEQDPTTLSTLVDASVANRNFLFWLAQFSGTKIINPTTGFTPWGNLPETWQEIDLIDFTDTGDDAAPWRAIQDYNTEPAGFEEFLRWQTGSGYYGIKAGTKESIIKAVERVLTGTQTVEYEIVDPFEWTIKIKTIKSETPDAGLIDIGGSVDKILELIEPCRPLGFIVVHELI